jgi:hypothetical protein
VLHRAYHKLSGEQVRHIMSFLLTVPLVAQPKTLVELSFTKTEL